MHFPTSKAQGIYWLKRKSVSLRLGGVKNGREKLRAEEEEARKKKQLGAEEWLNDSNVYNSEYPSPLQATANIETIQGQRAGHKQTN